MTSTPVIAILGAGPSGLTLARLLELATIEYIVFERDESPSSSDDWSGTLDVHVGTGQLALQEAGLLDEFNALARHDVRTIIADAKGTVHLTLGGDGDEDRPEIDRKDLRALLLRSVPAKKIRWGARVQQVQREVDGSMAVHVANGNVESGFRLVAGADGAWSKARSLVTTAKPQYSGLHYLTATVGPGNQDHSSAATLAGQGNYMAVGNGNMLAVQKLGSGYYIAAGLHLPEGWSRESALQVDSLALRQSLVQDNFASWPQVHKDLIIHSEGDLRAWPLYAMPIESLSWQTVPGITLIGDAAHVSTPFAGEGVNCAMHDSLQLARSIAKYGLDKLDQAVAEYEKSMFPRAVELITESKQNGELLFAPDGPRGFLEAFAGIGRA